MYRIIKEEQDEKVSLVYKLLEEKKELSEFELIVKDICSKYMSSVIPLSVKQQNVVGAIYYRQIHKYRKPTKKMIDDARKTEAFNIALQDEVKNILSNRVSIDELLYGLNGDSKEQEW